MHKKHHMLLIEMLFFNILCLMPLSDNIQQESSSLLQKNINSPSHSTHKDTISLLYEAYKCLHENDITHAINAVKEARTINVDNNELRILDTALQECIEKIEDIKLISTFEEKGDFLFDYWETFIQHHKNISSPRFTLSQQGIDSLQQFVMSVVKTCYKHVIQENPEKNRNVEFKIKIFRCLKLLGEYEKTIHIIKSLLSKGLEKAYLHSHLADCYYLTNKIPYAKLLFREAFFHNPTKIKLNEIEAEPIHTIASLIREENRYSEEYVKEWIPVYGYITKEFSLSRELTPIEFHNILIDIGEMESKLDDMHALGKDDPFVILPRLLNRYFWLIEHYKNTTKSQQEITAILDKVAKYENHIYLKIEI